jgi:hypothetical protein
VITIGRINTRRNSRTHMALNGKTFCGSGSRAPIRHIAQTFRDIDRASICKSCFTPANLTVAQIEVTTGSGFRAALDDFLCDVRLIVGYGAQAVRAVAPVVEVPVAPKVLSTWGAMAEGFRRTHAVRVR